MTNSKVTGSLIMRLGPQARPNSQPSLNQEPSNSFTTPLPTRPFFSNLFNLPIYSSTQRKRYTPGLLLMCLGEGWEGVGSYLHEQQMNSLGLHCNQEESIIKPIINLCAAFQGRMAQWVEAFLIDWMVHDSNPIRFSTHQDTTSS